MQDLPRLHRVTERLRERVIPHREHVVRTLCFHVFRIGEAFLETWNGAEYSVKIADNEPPDSLQTGDDIARYGAGVWKRYEALQAAEMGPLPAHLLARLDALYESDFGRV